MNAPKKMLIWSLMILILTNLFIILDIDILRQTFGLFAYLIIPGLIILLCLKVKNISFWKFLVYSLGLSIVFLVVIGLLINLALPLVGMAKPLALHNLLIGFNSLILFLWVIAYKRNKEEVWEEKTEEMNVKSKILFSIPLLFPVLAIIGAYQLNINPKGIIPMALLAIISLYVIVLVLLNKNKDVSKNVFPLAVFMIALSILFMVSLRSTHLFGCDVHGEYLASQLTKNLLEWKSTNYAYNNSLSISLFPVILSSIIGMDEEIFFTIISQILFAFVPMVIFLFVSKYTDDIYAFLSAFFFLSIEVFSIFMAIARSEIALLFVALSILILFDDEMRGTARKLLFIVFAIFIIFSHYTVSYIYLGLLVSVVIVNCTNKKERNHAGLITITTAFLFFAFIFFWNGQVISTPFNGIINFVKEIIQNITNMFVLETRSFAAVSAVSIPTEGQVLMRFNSYISGLMKLFIIIGLIYMAKNFKKIGIERNFLIFSLYSFLFVVLSIVLPLFTKEFNIGRIFLQSLTVLCFCCVLGAKYIFEKFRLKEDAINIIIASLLILFLLFQSGFIFNISGIAASPSLNDDSHAYRMWFVHDSEIKSAEWLAEQKPERVYGDHEALLRLWSYGKIIPHYSTSEEIQRGYSLTESTTGAMTINSYVYLRYDNVQNNNFLTKGERGGYIYIQNFDFLLKDRNKVYDNNGVKIFR